MWRFIFSAGTGQHQRAGYLVGNCPSHYFIGQLILLLVTGNCLAQGRWVPYGLRVGTDVVALASPLLSPGQTRFELSADADYGKRLLAFDLGYSAVNRLETAYAYQHAGGYFRLGIDKNLLADDPERNALFVGLRYGGSVYTERVSFNQVGAYWRSQPLTVENRGRYAQWGEVVAGVRVRAFRRVFIGFTGRFKLALTTGTLPLTAYNVPGFGLTNATWGLGYYVHYRFQVRKYVRPVTVPKP